MTGFGESHAQQDGTAVAVEVRSINNRYFKLTVRTSEGYAALESLVEAEVRQFIHRGTVQVNVRVDQRRSPEDVHINLEVLRAYRSQLATLLPPGHAEEIVRWEALLPLPGVVEDAAVAGFDASTDWPIIEQVLKAALDRMIQMRTKEGEAMAADLLINCRTIGASLEQIATRAPLVVSDYRDRLHERLNKLLAEFGVAADASDLIKEVCLPTAATFPRKSFACEAISISFRPR
jgi:uncharacterized protein (TIGR00255 family)